MADSDNGVLNASIEKYLPLIFLVALTVVLNYQRFVDYIIRFKYTGLIFLVLKLSFRVLTGVFLNIVLIPVLLLGYIIQWIISTANDIYVQVAISGNVTRASGFDTIYGIDSNVSPAFNNVIYKLDRKLDMEEYKKFFTERVMNIKSSSGQMQFPKFKQLFRTYGGYCYWEDDENYDIGNHIYSRNLCEMYPELSANKEVSGQDIVCRYIEDHGLEKVKGGSAPQWELTCLQTGDDEFFFICRIHHSYADGLSMRRLILEYLNDEPSTDTFELPNPSLPLRMVRALWAIALLPYAIGVLLFKGSFNPLHGPKLTGKKYFVAVPEIPFKLVKDIRTKSETSVQSVLYSATTNAFGKFFHKRSTKIPWLTAFYLIGISDPRAELKLENSFMIGLVSLPVPAFKSLDGKLYQEDSSFSNLLKTKQALRDSLEDATILAYYYLVTLYVNVMPVFLARMVSSCSGMTTALTNLPGPRKPLMTMKHTVSEMRVWPPDREPVAITVSYVSQNGVLRPNIIIDHAIVNSREEAVELGNNIVADIKNLAKELDIRDASE